MKAVMHKKKALSSEHRLARAAKMRSELIDAERRKAEVKGVDLGLGRRPLSAHTCSTRWSNPMSLIGLQVFSNLYT